jgi:hypothetical protein
MTIYSSLTPIRYDDALNNFENLTMAWGTSTSEKINKLLIYGIFSRTCRARHLNDSNIYDLVL